MDRLDDRRVVDLVDVVLVQRAARCSPANRSAIAIRAHARFFRKKNTAMPMPAAATTRRDAPSGQFERLAARPLVRDRLRLRCRRREARLEKVLEPFVRRARRQPDVAGRPIRPRARSAPSAMAGGASWRWRCRECRRGACGVRCIVHGCRVHRCVVHRCLDAARRALAVKRQEHEAEHVDRRQQRRQQPDRPEQRVAAREGADTGSRPC